MKRAIASSQGQRSSSVSGTPLFIFSTLAAGWNSSPSRKTQPSFFANKVAIVVLPEPGDSHDDKDRRKRGLVGRRSHARAPGYFSGAAGRARGKRGRPSAEGTKLILTASSSIDLGLVMPAETLGAKNLRSRRIFALTKYPPPLSGSVKPVSRTGPVTLHRFPSWVMFAAKWAMRIAFREDSMARRISKAVLALFAAALWSGAAAAQDSVKIGLILPMTGQQASTGRQIEAAARLFMQQNGDKVAGKSIELIVKDDTGTPDVSKRIAQELIVNDKVAFVAGFGLTPIALAVAPLATQAKVPEVVMAAGTATITEASPISCAPASPCRKRRCRWLIGR